MNKQTRIVFFGLIGIVAVLAASTVFFAAKSRQSGAKSSPSPKKTTTISDQSAATPTPQISTAVTRAASSSERPSNPTDTYTIQKGDSLFNVAEQNGLTMDELAAANNIIDTNKILSGQVLLIPKNGLINFTIDNTKATALQTSVDNGKFSWRTSPEEVARSDNAGAFGLKTTDSFTLKDKNLVEGQATVLASHEGKNYLIKLTEPITKGDKGIWAIVSIAPTT